MFSSLVSSFPNDDSMPPGKENYARADAYDGLEEAMYMDLRNNQITLGELWDNTQSRAVFQKRIPMLSKHPVKGAARTVTLAQLADFLSGWVPQMMINGVMQDLKKL